MAVKYFLRSTTVESTCDVGGTSESDTDINQTQGSDGTVSAIVNVNIYQVEMSFDINVDSDSPATGDVDVSVQVDAATDVDYRFFISAIDDAGCVNDATVQAGGTFSGTGVKTATASNLAWAGSSNRLRLRIDCTRTTVHGNKTFTVNCSHADSHITAQGFGTSGQTITPDAVNDTQIVAVAPTVVLGNLTITPDPRSITIRSGSLPFDPTIHFVKTPDSQDVKIFLGFPPTVVLGTLTLTPDALAMPLVTAAPTIDVVKTPDALAMTLVTAAPTVAPTLTLTPDALGMPLVTAASTIVLGTLTLTPDALAMTLVTAAPTVAPTLTLTPDALAMPLVTAAPTIDVVKTPDALAIPLVTAASTIVLGTLTLTPDALAMPLVTAAPTIDVVKTPDAVTMPLLTAAPTVTLGGSGQTLTPDALAMPLVTAAPTVVPTLTIAPGFAIQFSFNFDNQAVTILHSLTLTPAVVAMPLVTAAPTIDVVKTPDALAMPLLTAAPTVTLGGDVLTPDAVAWSLSVPAPTIALSLLMTPSSGTVPMLLAAPTINLVKTPAALGISIVIAMPLVEALAYTTLGPIFLFTAAEWASGCVFKLEASFRSTNGGKVGVRLFDVTGGLGVNGTAMSKTSTSLARHRSSAFTMIDGNEYRLQVGVNVSAEGAVLGAKILGLSP